MAKQVEEQRDELGFTLSGYCDMQQLKEKDGKLNDTLLNGWDITPEQITLINNPHHPLHSAAVIAFYDVNLTRLTRMAKRFLCPPKITYSLISVISYEDLLQQVFLDLYDGVLKLPHDTENISTAIYRSFRYAAVGGLDGVDDVEEFRAA